MDTEITSSKKPQNSNVLRNLPNSILGLVNAFVDLRQLWMTCRELWWSEARREIVYLKLNRKSSEEFLKNKVFREFVKTRVLNTSKQISINFEDSFIQNVDELDCVHALNLNGCGKVKDVSALRNVLPRFMSALTSVISSQ